uniref:Uncharacterized protein n=1 Tax=Glossina pallidipes TaxID=7398 RepID=A0A1B0AEX6_GLOPL
MIPLNTNTSLVSRVNSLLRNLEKTCIATLAFYKNSTVCTSISVSTLAAVKQLNNNYISINNTWVEYSAISTVKPCGKDAKEYHKAVTPILKESNKTACFLHPCHRRLAECTSVKDVEDASKFTQEVILVKTAIAASKMKGSLRRVFSNLPKRTIRPTSTTPSSSEDNSRPSRTICINSSHKLRNSVCRFSISFKRNSMRERSQFKSSGKLRFIKARTCVDAVKFVANSLLVKCVMAVGAIIADVSGGVGA